MDKIRLADMIDNTVLKADASLSDLDRICNESIKYGFKAVMINPSMIEYCVKKLAESEKKIEVGTVIGFPLGQNTIETKVFETRNAISKGATEIDYVINIARLKAGNMAYLKDEMQSILEVTKAQNIVSKVIIETCCLTDEQKREICALAAELGVDFVKTSTGFGVHGATVNDVLLMKSVVGDRIKVKASGGIKSLDFALSLIESGAERIGTSSGAALLEALAGGIGVL